MPNLIDGDKLAEHLQNSAKNYLPLKGDYRRGKHDAFVDALIDLRSGRFSVTRQGQEERDYTPEEALAEAQKRWGKVGFAMFDSMNATNPEVLYRVGFLKGIHRSQPSVTWFAKSFRSAFASADKAQVDKPLNPKG